MNWNAAIEYLDMQSRFCAERAKLEESNIDTVHNMFLLADIYAVAAGAIRAGLTPATSTWSGDERTWVKPHSFQQRSDQ